MASNAEIDERAGDVLRVLRPTDGAWMRTIVWLLAEIAKRLPEVKG